MSIEVKQDFGRYQVLNLLGKGGFGTVYEAYDSKLNRTVALKVLNKGVAGDSLQRFSREAEICVRLRHPNIITIYDASTRDGRAFIVMERLEAEELAELLHFDELSEKDALSIIVQIANAVDYLDGEGILHRDIKPQNIMVTSSGRAVLMDFNLGLSDDMTALTATGVVVGTPRYMAPELWIGEPYTLSSEIYALGLVFHHMLTGVAAAVRDRKEIKEGLPPVDAPSQVKEGCTNAYDEFVLWTTHADLSERCSKISDFLEALAQTTPLAQRTVEQYNPEASSSRAVIPSSTTSQTKNRQSFWRKMVVTFPVVLLLLAFSFFHFQPLKKRIRTPKVSLQFCPFPDGCYGAFKSKLTKPPLWRVLSSNIVVKEGKCHANGPRWEIQVQGLSGKGSFTLQVTKGNDVLLERAFRLVESVFKEPLQAFVGRQRVELKWRLHGDVEATVKGRCNVNEQKSEESKGRGRAVFMLEARAFLFDYDFYVGNRRISSHQVRLGCVSRRNRRHFPEKPAWKIRTTPIVFPSGVIVGNTDRISFLGVDRGPSGPFISLRWQTMESTGTSLVFCIQEDERWCLSLTVRDERINLARIDCVARTEMGRQASPHLGNLKGEFIVQFPSLQMPPKHVSATLIERGLLLAANVGADKVARSYLVDYKNGRAKVIPGPALGKADALWLGKQVDGLACISCLKGVVMHTTLKLNEAKTDIIKCAVRSLFQARDSGRVLTIGSMKRKVRKKKYQSDLAVEALSNNRCAIRAGGTTSFYRLSSQESIRCGPLVKLPISVANRTSRALELDHNRVGYVLVLRANNLVAAMRAYLYRVDLSKGADLAVQRTLIGKSVLHTGYEAICGGVGYHDGCYYVPALEHVHVISKRDGKHLAQLYAEWRPNFAIPVNGMLFVPLNIRKLLGMDLLDEF